MSYPTPTEDKVLEELRALALENTTKVIISVPLRDPCFPAVPPYQSNLDGMRDSVYAAMYVPAELMQQQSRIFRVEKVRKRGPIKLMFPLDDFPYITAEELARMKVDSIYKSQRWSWGDYALLAAFFVVPWALTRWFGG